MQYQKNVMVRAWTAYNVIAKMTIFLKIWLWNLNDVVINSKSIFLKKINEHQPACDFYGCHDFFFLGVR